MAFSAQEIDVKNAVENAARRQADEAYQQRDLDTNVWSLFAPVRAATKVTDELYDWRQYLALELVEAYLVDPDGLEILPLRREELLESIWVSFNGTPVSVRRRQVITPWLDT